LAEGWVDGAAIVLLCLGRHLLKLSAMHYTPLLLVIPFLPLLPVAIAWLRRAYPRLERDKKRHNQIAAENAPTPGNPQSFGYHQAEFVVLKTEVADTLKTMSSNFQYAILASAGVFTWFASADHITGHEPLFRLNYDLVQYAVWLPYLVSVFFFTLSMGLYTRLSEIRQYLGRLERALGTEGLGYEAAFSNRPVTLAVVWGWAWIVLIVGNFELARLLPSPTTVITAVPH
jgi:hypothetical protein